MAVAPEPIYRRSDRSHDATDWTHGEGNRSYGRSDWNYGESDQSHDGGDRSYGRSDWNYGENDRIYGRSDWNSSYLTANQSDIVPDGLHTVIDSRSESSRTTNVTSSNPLKLPSDSSITSNHPSPTKIAWNTEERKKNVAGRAVGNHHRCRFPQSFRWKCCGIGAILCLFIVGAVLGSVLGVVLIKEEQHNPTNTTISNPIMSTNASTLIAVIVTTTTVSTTTSYLFSTSTSVTTYTSIITTNSTTTTASTIITVTTTSTILSSTLISSTTTTISTTMTTTTVTIYTSSTTGSTSTFSSTVSTTTALITTSTTTTITTSISTSATISTTISTTTTIAPVLICSSYYNTTLLLNIINPSSSTYPYYVMYSYSWAATGTSATLALYTRHDPWGWDIDDFSVTYNGSTQLLTNGGFETGDLTGWNYTSGSGGCNSDSSYVAHSSSYAHTGSYYYYGRCNGACDIIRQTFPTIVGRTYNISYWLVNYDCCSKTEIIAVSIT